MNDEVTTGVHSVEKLSYKWWISVQNVSIETVFFYDYYSVLCFYILIYGFT